MADDASKHMSGDSFIDKLTAFVGGFAKWLCLFLVLLQFSVVLARYFFDTGSVMAQEAILFMFGSMFMLSLAETLKSDRHVRVDMLYHKFPDDWRRRIDATGLLIFLLPICAFLIWVSWGYVATSWRIGEGSRDPSGLPGVYLFKAVILVAFVLLICQGVAILARCIRPGVKKDA